MFTFTFSAADNILNVITFTFFLIFLLSLSLTPKISLGHLISVESFTFNLFATEYILLVVTFHDSLLNSLYRSFEIQLHLSFSLCWILFMISLHSHSHASLVLFYSKVVLLYPANFIDFHFAGKVALEVLYSKILDLAS